MKYVVETGTGAMIYISIFINIGSRIKKLIKGRYPDIQTA
jgi:hypothetical protein